MNLVLSEKYFNEVEEKVSSLNRHKKANIAINVVKEFYKEFGKGISVKFVEFSLAINEDVSNKDIVFVAKKKIEDDIFILTEINQVAGEEGIKVPDKYKNTSAFCDHCGTDRPRKTLYIIFNKNENKYYQVGKSCINDFLGTENGIEDYLKMIEYFDSITNYAQELEKEEYRLLDEDFMGFIGGYGKISINIRVFIAACYEVMKTRKMQYVSKSDLNNILYDEATFRKLAQLFGTDKTSQFKTTKEEACELIKEYRDKSLDFSESSLAFADEVIKYVKETDFDSEVMENAQNICNSEHGFCPVKWLGFLAFLPNTYLKHQEHLKKQAEIEEKYAKDYLGAEKEKFSDLPVKVVSTHIFDTYYGCSMIINMIDDKKHFIMWKTSAKDEFMDFEEGTALKLKGSIKELTTYNGIPQTVVTRCKVEVV